jgi:hypothetical protein
VLVVHGGGSPREVAQGFEPVRRSVRRCEWWRHCGPLPSCPVLRPLSTPSPPLPLAQYEAAKTHRTEVPRMLFDLRLFADLNAYVDSKADKVRGVTVPRACVRRRVEFRWGCVFAERGEKGGSVMLSWQGAGTSRNAVAAWPVRSGWAE